MPTAEEAKQGLIDELSTSIVKLLDADWVTDAVDELVPDIPFDDPESAEAMAFYDNHFGLLMREVTGVALLDAFRTILIGIPNP